MAEFHVGSFGAVESLVGAYFARQLLHRIGRLVRYDYHRIPWHRLDLTDPDHPKTLDTVEQLKAKQRSD